jgi:hypothetical protein
LFYGVEVAALPCCDDAGAWMITVLVLVAVRPDWSVATY